MILCVESWKGDILLSGKRIRIRQLQKQIRTAEDLCDPAEDNFTGLLCRMFGWEPAADPDDCIPDYLYDRDTGLILKVSP